jgi:peroxiredoxin
MKTLPFALALLGCGSSSETGSAETSAPAASVAEVGRPAPDFELPDQDGVPHRLADLRGKIVVLEWTNSECPFVNRAYDREEMTRPQASFPADRVAWLGIDSTSFHTAETSKEWRQRRSISWPILQDPAGRVGHAYGARATPHMFVIDAAGVLRYAGAIDDDPHGEKHEPTNHVVGAVQALLDGGAPPVDRTDAYGCSVKYRD